MTASAALPGEERQHLRRHQDRIDGELPRIVASLYEELERREGYRSLLGTPHANEELLAILVDWATALFEAPGRARLIDRPTQLASWVVGELVAGGLSIVRRAFRATVDGDETLALAIEHLFDLEAAGLLARRDRDLAERHARDALAERMEAMQRLTAGFAHELRNPINAACLQLEVLQRRSGETWPEHPAALALGELHAITNLLDDFLLFARPSPLVAEDHELVALVTSALEGEREFAELQRVDVRLIAEIGPTHVTVDGAKLACIVAELVHNAIEAAAPRGHVTVELALHERCFEVAIRDDGVGIVPEAHARIYEPFFSTRDHGRGLGLSIVHAFVALHRGRIDMTSGSRGTRFVVTIPRYQT